MKKYIAIFVVCGLVHALFSLYWGFGGVVGLKSVGQWAITLNANYGIWVNLALVVVAMFKAFVTLLPLTLLDHYHKVVYFISFVMAIFLILYGGLNTIIGWLKVLGIIENFNFYTTFGQAFVWDPLFLLWGIGLFIYLLKIKKLK